MIGIRELTALGARFGEVPMLQPQPVPLHDRTPDPGLFGPHSVTWRVLREPILIVGGGRALLLQAAHPLVAQGAIDHSTYRTDPRGRLYRTLEWVTVCAFGTTAEARASCRRVNRLHGRVQGRLGRGHGTPAHPAGSPYSARDPELLEWVHTSLVDTMLASHDALVGGLDEADADRFVREWNSVAALMGVPRDRRWRTRAELSAHVAEGIRSGWVAPGRGSREVADTVMAPPLPSRMALPAWRLMVFTMLGLLPETLREGYDITWTPLHDAAHRALCIGLRAAHPGLPRRLRVSPVYDWATRRVHSTGRSGRRAAA